MITTSQASIYPWYASFKADFQQKKGSQKKTITVTNTYTHPTQLPIIVERSYSDQRAKEYFALAPIDQASYSKIINHPDNITQVRELRGIFNNDAKAKKDIISFYKEKNLGIFHIKNTTQDEKKTLLGMIKFNGFPFSTSLASDPYIPYLEEELAVIVCSPKYVQNHIGQSLKGLARMGIPIFIQKEMHEKGLDKMFVQVSVRTKNKKSNAAMQSLFGPPVATRLWRRYKYTVHYYQHVFTKLGPSTTNTGNTSTFPITPFLLSMITFMAFILLVKKKLMNDTRQKVASLKKNVPLPRPLTATS